MIIHGKEEFQKSAEYADLAQHRAELLKFYASDAFKAQQSFLEVEKARMGQVALTTGRTAEERENARGMYNAWAQMLKLPEFIGSIFEEPTQPENI